MKNAAVGIAAAGLKMEGFGKSWITDQEEIKFVQGTLGRTGLEVPVVSFGVMNSDSPDLINHALDRGIKHLDTAFLYLRGNSDRVKEAIRYAAQKGVGVVAMKTQGGASLQQEGQIKIDHTAALKWIIQDENVCTAIPGMTTYEQLDQNLRTMNDLALTMEEKTSLNESRKFAESLFCQNCRSCIETCPQRIEIPNIVRAYMYAYGYKNIIQAKDTIMELPEEKGIQICRLCPSCSAHCSHRIDIQMRINALIKKNGVHLSILQV